MDFKMKRQLTIFGGIVLLVLIFGFGINSYIGKRASMIGTSIGSFSGKVVGTAIGSAKGITTGASEGAKAGAEEGLSAKDTTVDIKSAVTSIGKLEVMDAEVTMVNDHKIGNTYRSLYLISGNIVFTVDFHKADVTFSQDGSEVYIRIPRPEPELYVDFNSTKQLAESQKFSLSVDAEDGLKAYLNSWKKTMESFDQAIDNYEDLVTAAEETAKKQVVLLVSNLSGADRTIKVEFI